MSEVLTDRHATQVMLIIFFARLHSHYLPVCDHHDFHGKSKMSAPAATAANRALSTQFVVYTTSPLIGSPGEMYNMLQEATVRAPVAGNAGGSYLTMRSKSGLIFGVINIVSSLSSRISGAS